jgi:hypothetical protein
VCSPFTRNPNPRATPCIDGSLQRAARVRRNLVLGAALAFIAGFAFLTVTAVVEDGFTVASLLSVVILVLLAIGIVGALRNPPS